ncbi:DEAD-domain-containing protein [Meredithblackwellia eburnea MCA 4105]
MDDDFQINFVSTDAPGAKRTGGTNNYKQGGRWTDRAKEKRKQQSGSGKKQQRSENGGGFQQGSPASTSQPAKVLGKRTRDEGDSNGPRPKAGGGGQHLRRQQQQGQDQEGGGAGAGRIVTGPGGKKQYISSLFTAEGLPIPAAPAAPIIPSRPSNAPMRAAPTAREKDETEILVEEATAPSAASPAKPAPKPSPAPALSALGLLPEIVSHLVTKLDVTGPTACQSMALPPLLKVRSSQSTSLPPGTKAAHDAILQSQTGSGKTLAFLLPLIQDLLTLPRNLFPAQVSPTRSIGTLAIILAPTRELASQIYDVVCSLLTLPSSTGAQTEFTFAPFALTPCLLVGGANRTHEKNRIRKGCPIVVATPGRLLDHLRTTESFRLAGEPIKTKGPQGRPGTGANHSALGTRGSGAGEDGRPLGLRWLVVDECDRLMDLGFEEQMKGVLEELERRSPSAVLKGNAKGRRRTILCSATASEGVDRLAGMALHEPVTITVSTSAASADNIVAPKPKSSKAGAKDEENAEADPTAKQITFTPPTQLVHSYIVVPPKLRFVALLALMRRILLHSTPAEGSAGPGHKVLVFLSCTAAVDFFWEALGALSLSTSSSNSASEQPTTNVLENPKEKAAREKAEAEKEAAEKGKLASETPLLPGVPIYRLHGNLELSTRLGSLEAFSHKTEAKAGKRKGQETENAVLLCTSVAARGLDVQYVSHVIQFDLPTEGGVTEYIHRAGRTARAGASGQVTSFLLPSEKEWVPWVEAGMKDGAEKRAGGSKDVKLRELGVESVLKDGYGGDGREFETRATDVQMGYERWVADSDDNSTLARNAFASHIRAYATHPSAEKSMFNTKLLHLGHLAKSFGMREAPSAHTNSKSKKVGKNSRGDTKVASSASRKFSAREQAERAIASLPSRGGKSGEFETGRRHDEERAKKRMQQKLMMGPTGDGAGDYQVASLDMLDGLAKAQGSSKRKR